MAICFELCYLWGLSSSGDSNNSDKTSFWELAGLEVAVELLLIDFELLVRGMQGVTERVGLNNSVLLL